MTSKTIGPAFVAADATLVHKELAEHEATSLARGDFDTVRPIFDIVFDWVIAIVAASCIYRYGTIVALPALLLIANRQRALGNLLHEAGHRNLYRAGRYNDFVARAFLAPALLVDLDRYRATHARHHAMLGMPNHDPDYITPMAPSFPGWWRTYARLLVSFKGWLGSVLGHVTDRSIALKRRLFPVGWWIALWALMASIAGPKFAGTFVASWYLAKATAFHAITMMREMCDHYGLRSGGIYSFTRDIVVHRLLRWIIHPHNNGFHLTHHLMPSVPYYQLPTAWETISHLPSYRVRGIVCTAYFMGPSSVVHMARNPGASVA